MLLELSNQRQVQNGLGYGGYKKYVQNFDTEEALGGQSFETRWRRKEINNEVGLKELVYVIGRWMELAQMKV
jgi:hypothetical protein